MPTSLPGTVIAEFDRHSALGELSASGWNTVVMRRVAADHASLRSMHESVAAECRFPFCACRFALRVLVVGVR
jgi:hypothetical protein